MIIDIVRFNKWVEEKEKKECPLCGECQWILSKKEECFGKLYAEIKCKNCNWFCCYYEKLEEIIENSYTFEKSGIYLNTSFRPKPLVIEYHRKIGDKE